eukprot:6689563-Alexandrium_andersonii.AAC.1
MPEVSTDDIDEEVGFPMHLTEAGGVEFQEGSESPRGRAFPDPRGDGRTEAQVWGSSQRELWTCAQ